MNSASLKRGYSMIEAMVSVLVLIIGITSILGGYAALSKGQRAIRASEQMQRLALDKYDELVSTGSLETVDLNGDFSDRGVDGYQWNATVETTGVENLSALTVTVESKSGAENASISGTVFTPPASTTTTTGGQP